MEEGAGRILTDVKGYHTSNLHVCCRLLVALLCAGCGNVRPFQCPFSRQGLSPLAVVVGWVESEVMHPFSLYVGVCNELGVVLPTDSLLRHAEVARRPPHT